MPVICLHGLTRNSRDFEDVAPGIARLGRRVIVPDVRGRGRSERDPNVSNYNPRTYARDVLDLLDALGVARAVFVGTSMGGIIAMAVAMMRGKAVSAAVLNDIGPAVAPEGIARITSYAGQPAAFASWDDAAAYVERTNAVAFPDFEAADWRAVVQRTFREGPNGEPELDYDPDIARPIAGGRIKPSSLIAWWMFRRLARRPTLLIRGELSDVNTRDIARRMQRAAPMLRVVEVPRVGHAPMLTEPVAREAVRNFLGDLP